MSNTNHPFHTWVPRPVGITVLLCMFVPPTFSGGAYMSNISEMTGGLGVQTEDIQLAAFFTSIGMCLFAPFMLRFLQTRRVKQTFLACFLLLLPLNYLCAVAHSLPLLLGACLLTGFVRMAAMLNCTFTIAPYLTGMDTLAMFTMTEEPSAEVQYALERKRTFLMPVLYVFILLISQACNLLTAWCAHYYHWQHAYYGVMGLLLVALLLVVCTMPTEKRTSEYRMEWQKLPDMLLMAVALCALAYLLVYGQTLDWLSAPSVRGALALLLLSGGLFLFSSFSRHPSGAYLPPGVFAYRNVWMSMLLFLLTMVGNAANGFAGLFVKLATPACNWQAARLSAWAMAGCLAGFLLAIFMVARKVRFRTVFCMAFLLMAAGNVCLYFQYQPAGLLSQAMVPVMLNYAGLLMLYSLVAAFGMKHLPSRYLVAFVFLMIWMRNAIAPMVGSAVYANLLNHRQQYYVTRLAQAADAGNAQAVATFRQAAQKGLREGKSSGGAEEFAATVLKGRLTVQATLTAMKEITGVTVMGLLGMAVGVLLLPYHPQETT